MSHARPASWQHWADTLKASKSTFKDKGRVHTSRTLFLAQIPANISVSDLESLFRQAPGYVTARRVRSMGFIDFESKQQATDALGRFQGHRFPGAERGLLISYDKDDEEERGGSSKRQHEEMRRRKEELERTYTKLHCYVCAHFALKLTTALAQLPVRKTDGSRVVSEAQLVSLDMVRTRPPPPRAARHHHFVPFCLSWLVTRSGGGSGEGAGEGDQAGEGGGEAVLAQLHAVRRGAGLPLHPFRQARQVRLPARGGVAR